MLCHRKRNRMTNFPYVKKPTFMIFEKEQRKKVMEDLKIRDSTAVNAVLGKLVCELFTGSTKTLEAKHSQSGFSGSVC